MKSKNSKGFTGIFRRIFAISLLCMTIPALINTVTLSRLTKKYFQDEAGHSLQNVATEKKNQMELALSSIATQAQSIANQTFLIESLNNALINSKDPDQATLRKISENLEYNFELGEGLFENIFLMYKNRDIADGIGGKSVGWEDETVGSADSLLVREVRASPTTGRPVMTIVAPIKKSNRHLGTIAMAIELNSVSEKIIDNVSSDEDYKTLILNSSGLVISSDNPDHVLSLNFQEEAGLQDFFETMGSEKTGVGFLTLDGLKCFAAYNHSSTYGMYFITYKSEKAYMKLLDAMKNILPGVSLISILIATIIIYFASRSMTKPILTVTEQAELLSQGNLYMKMPDKFLKRKDELGRLARSFDSMILNLKTITQQISDTSSQVAASSQELYASGEQVGKAAENVGNKIMEMATGAEEQSAQIDSTLISLKNLMEQIDEVNIKTDNMEKTTTEMIEDISRGSKSAEESVIKINNLKADTEEISNVITKLGYNSNQIGQIIEIISGIAEQTNLLALNAAIEAARAGEAGKGFSVVADEIRKLAEESADASDRIAELIVEIRNGVDNAVNMMDSSIKSVDSSVDAIQENGDIFASINREAEQLKNIVADVIRSVRKMTESSLSFEQTMQEINKVSQDFALNSQDVSASSEEQIAVTEEIVTFSKSLATMAEELSALISNFKF
jgi:methyl-accepting chemotaxis protein